MHTHITIACHTHTELWHATHTHRELWHATHSHQTHADTQNYGMPHTLTKHMQTHRTMACHTLTPNTCRHTELWHATHSHQTHADTQNYGMPHTHTKHTELWHATHSHTHTMLNDTLSEESLPHLYHLHSGPGSGRLRHHPIHKLRPTAALLVCVDMDLVVTAKKGDGKSKVKITKKIKSVAHGIASIILRRRETHPAHFPIMTSEHYLENRHVKELSWYRTIITEVTILTHSEHDKVGHHMLLF